MRGERLGGKSQFKYIKSVIARHATSGLEVAGEADSPAKAYHTIVPISWLNTDMIPAVTSYGYELPGIIRYNPNYSRDR